MSDWDELKKAAEIASLKGDWFEEGSSLFSYYDKSDADFMVAATPIRILELIACAENAELNAQRYQWMIEHGAPEDWQAVGNQEKPYRSTYVDTFIRKGESHD